MQQRAIKVVFLADGNAKDVRLWSGTTSHIANALEKQPEIETYYINNVEKSRNYFTLIIGAIFSRVLRLFGKEYLCRWTLGTAKRFAKFIEKELTKLPKDIDVIFSIATTMSMAFLKTDAKKIYCSDGTFACMINYYPCFFNLCNRTLREVNIIDKNAFENCDLLLFPSDWAANSAINDYNINPSKVKVIPFGANIEKEYSDIEIQNIIKNRSSNKCNLLFIGVDWERKGGNIVLEIAKELHSQNVNVHLDIVGIKNLSLPLPDYVTNHSFISKKTEEGKNKMIKLFEEAHFFVLPTRQECYGIVYAEASSFAVPSITTKTGGVETAVKDNINGMTFDLSDSPKKYADHIVNLFNNRAEYEKLCLSSFNDYKTRLNWNVAGEQMLEVIKEIIKK